MYDLGAVITAAGLSSRMGRFKPMLPWGKTTVIREIISKFQSAGVQKIVVVTGYQADLLEAHIKDTGVRCVRNEHYRESQMFDSAKIGFSQLSGICKRVFFMPTDIPFFKADTLKKLTECEDELVCPTVQGKKGHPLLLSAGMLDFFIHYTGEQGLKGAISASGVKMHYLPVDDRGMLYDLDTMEDYQQLIEISGICR